uniref:Structural maintenance of chromosomes protein n=1 Tax=Trypanosoma congolense (strain IL3000) TaxID=1068625 RepID=G0UUM0_TRYCI|nr:putative structural maintenance of chromosome 1 [Trypanosoma congolense IL3000]
MLSRIDRVELFNFKSYSGHVTVGPFKDFTCIVGPNGSGKSNLMDALCFVLSFNSATSLRGHNLTDLIHRGAEQRECFVTVVLRRGATAAAAAGKDVSTEMSFTRSVDRSGQLTHKIDNKPVSLHDFLSALKKFNVCPRVKNFLVFQNDVECVAQKKAQELTELLEQVSGSAELKSEYDRCKEACELANRELYLASTAKREAISTLNQARHHKKEVEKYDETLKQITNEKRDEALVELLHIEKTLIKSKEALTDLTDKLAALEREGTSDRELSSMKHELAEKHRALAEQSNAFRKDNEKLRDMNTTLNRIRHSLRHLSDLRGRKKMELDDALAKESIQASEAERVRGMLNQHKSILSSFEKRCVEEDKNYKTLNNVLTDEQLKEYRQLQKEAGCQTVVLRQQLETVMREQQSLREAKKQCVNFMANVELEKGELVQRVQRGNKYVSEQQNLVKEIRDKVSSITRDIEDKKAELARTERRRKENTEELEKVDEQLKELNFVKVDNKRDAKIADALHTLRSLYNIRGRLVDLCTIPNNKYRHAVTVAFGKNLDAIVVDTSEVAHACVRYLKEHHLPPLTFLPLNSVEGKTVDDRLRILGGTCKPVVDVIRYDISIEAAVRYALGQTLVCDTMAEAKRVAYDQESGERFRVVTVDGTLLMRSGVVQGGLSTVQSRARKWDEKKYNALCEARNRLLNDLEEDSDVKVTQVQNELKNMKYRLDALKTRERNAEAEIETTKKNMENMQNEIKRQEKDLVSMTARKEGYEGRLLKCETEVSEHNGSIKAIEDKIFDEFQKRVNIPNIRELERDDEVRMEKREKFRNEQKVLISQFEILLEGGNSRVGVRSAKEISDEYKKIEEELKRVEGDLSIYTNAVKEVQQRLSDLRTRYAQTKDRLKHLDTEIANRTKRSAGEDVRINYLRKIVMSAEGRNQALRSQRMRVVQRCEMEGVPIPLKPAEAGGSKRQRVADTGDCSFSEPFSLFEENDPSSQQQEQPRRPRHINGTAPSGGKVVIDFSGLPATLKQVASDVAQLTQYKQRTRSLLETLQNTADALAPNMREAARIEYCEQRADTFSAEFEAARVKGDKAHSDFAKIKELRTQRFMETFKKIAHDVGRIYCALTMDTRAHAVHGSACLSLEDNEEPYLGGTRYHATPPMKRYMSMELLSGGERTMAALALLFAVHAVSPTPFFVLDEVDAALDASNVERLANYTRRNCSTTQFIVISLKEQLYHMADMLVGVLKDKSKESSSILTMDLRGYSF